MNKCNTCAHYEQRNKTSQYGLCGKNLIKLSSGSMRQTVREDMYCDKYRKSIRAILSDFARFMRG